jgi:hypothetical protein
VINREGIADGQDLSHKQAMRLREWSGMRLAVGALICSTAGSLSAVRSSLMEGVDPRAVARATCLRDDYLRGAGRRGASINRTEATGGGKTPRP